MSTSNETMIKVKGVSKTFKLPHEKQTSIKNLFVNISRRQKSFEKQKALDNISFEIKKGEFFGIVGRNGSGKSTLLKLLAGIYNPDNGTIEINGKLTPFIELGVGFNPELTGRENVYLNGALLGFNRKEMIKMYDEIVDFAELKKFMDQKLKNYSSGMQVRLAFAIAIQAKANILLLDEVLAVGDVIFQKKCFDYFKTLKKEKRTVVFVSHDSSSLEEYCTRGLLIENGRIHTKGKISTVVRNYMDLVNKSEETSAKKLRKNDEKNLRWGTGKMSIETVVTKDGSTKRNVFLDNDKEITITVKTKAHQRIDDPVIGIIIQDAAGIRVFESNTKRQKIKTRTIAENSVVVTEWVIPNCFNTGTYTISPAVANTEGTEMFDWRDGYRTFNVRKTQQSSSIINVKHKVLIKGAQ